MSQYLPDHPKSCCLLNAAKNMQQQATDSQMKFITYYVVFLLSSLLLSIIASPSDMSSSIIGWTACMDPFNQLLLKGDPTVKGNIASTVRFGKWA